MSYSNERIMRIRQKLEAAGLDAAYIRNTSNIRWLSGIDGVFDFENAHAAFVTPQGVFIHTDSRYALAMSNAAKGSGIVVDDSTKTHAEWLAALIGADPGLAAASIAIEDGIALAEFRKLEEALNKGTAPTADAASLAQAPRLVETSNLVVNLRAQKDADEVSRLKAAQAITDAAFAYIVGFIKPGMSEREVQIELEDFMIRHGAGALAFTSIVAAGAKSASPHSIADGTLLEAGQAVVLDFGARAFDYCSDMTRTVFLGTPDERFIKAYAAVRRANEEVEAVLKPGVIGADMQALAEGILAQAGFGGAMGHGLGHGVGIDIHEEPVLASRNKEALHEGDVVTVEPGVYLEGEFGIRLEDFGILTHDGFEVFTTSSHDMVII